MTEVWQLFFLKYIKERDNSRTAKNEMYTGSVIVAKEVVGSDDTTEEFSFRLSFPTTRTSIPGFTVEGGVAYKEFSLHNGEQVTITGIPVPATVTVQELDHVGYFTEIRNGVELLEAGDSYTFSFALAPDQAQNLDFQNTPATELPNSGGAGTSLYATMGALLMLSSLVYGFGLRRRRERGAAA